jgi:membrane fusion protein (multidrug efflux system)
MAWLSIWPITLVRAQPTPTGPPAVGVMEAVKRPITETNEYLGRIEATNRVAVVACATAFLEKRLFDEGAEVKTGAERHGGLVWS